MPLVMPIQCPERHEILMPVACQWTILQVLDGKLGEFNGLRHLWNGIHHYSVALGRKYPMKNGQK